MLYWLRGLGDGTFALPAAVPSGTDYYEQFGSDTVFDTNKDGRDDLATIHAGISPTNIPTLHVGVSNGDGSFREAITSLPVDSPDPGNFLPPPAFAGFNGDGKIDLIFAATSHVWVLKGHGDGSFDSTGTAHPVPLQSAQNSGGIGSVVTGDFDGDGKLDFAVLVYLAGPQYFYSTDDRSAVFVYYGNGDGTFQPAIEVGPFIRDYGTPATGDFNQDGLPDLVLTTGGHLGAGSAIGIVHAQPGRSFGPEINYYPGTAPSSVDVADLNRDGFPDLVLANGGPASSVTVLMNLGNVPMVSGTLRASPEPSTLSETVTLNAGLAPPIPATLAGTVTFAVDGASVGSAPLAANTATLPIGGTLARGTHTLSATWSGDATYSPVALTGVHRVVGRPVAATLAATPNPALVGQSVTLSFAASGSSGVPTGQVTLTDGGTALGKATPSPGRHSHLPHQLPGSRQPRSYRHLRRRHHLRRCDGHDRRDDLGPWLRSFTQKLRQSRLVRRAGDVYRLRLRRLAVHRPFGHRNGHNQRRRSEAADARRHRPGHLPGGIESVGTLTLSATYSGDVRVNPLGPTSLTEVILASTTSTTLTATPNPAYQGQPVTLVVQVAGPPAAPQPTAPETVQLYDGAVQLATVTLNGRYGQLRRIVFIGWTTYTHRHLRRRQQPARLLLGGCDRDYPSVGSFRDSQS